MQEAVRKANGLIMERRRHTEHNWRHVRTPIFDFLLLDLLLLF